LPGQREEEEEDEEMMQAKQGSSRMATHGAPLKNVEHTSDPPYAHSSPRQIPEEDEEVPMHRAQGGSASSSQINPYCAHTASPLGS